MPDPLSPFLEATTTCAWVERDLCSRCHGPRRPTRRQAGELARIADRHGQLTVHAAAGDGWLTVILDGRAPDDLSPIDAPVFSMSPRGRLVAAGLHRDRPLDRILAGRATRTAGALTDWRPTW